MSTFNVGSGLDFLVNLVRYRISDLKHTYTTVAQEDVGAATGSAQSFYTDNMPVVSGFDTHLRIGRWYYTPAASDVACAGLRSYVFILESGAFRIPANAIMPTSGDRAKASYTWREEQTPTFIDDEIKLYIGDAVTTVNNTWYNFGHAFTVTGERTFNIDPMPGGSDLASYIYAQYASYLMKKQLESEGANDRIYVRDINITIDTSKGLGELSKSSKELYDNFKNMINEIKLKGQESVFARIDTYSTYPIISDSYKYQSNYKPDTEYFGDV